MVERVRTRTELKVMGNGVDASGMEGKVVRRRND